MEIASAPRVASTTTVSFVEMASDSAIDLTLTVSSARARRGEVSTTKRTREDADGDASSSSSAVAIERAVRALRSSDADARAARARYDAALTLYRALAIRANREAAETVDAAAACETALTRAVAADDDDTDDVDERARGVRRETAVCAMGALARVRGDGEAAETLRGVGGRMVGAALARWTSLRCVGTSSDEATRALSASDLVRFASIISKSADSPASRAFCDCGGVSSLLALVDADDGESSMNSAAMFDAAKAVAGFCASNSTRFDVESVTEEIEAILQSSSGTMRDYLPAVAATMLRRAAASLAKRPASRRRRDGALERQSSYNISNLTDCVAVSDDVRVAVAVATSTDDDESAGLTRSFGSKINLSRTRSSSLDSLGAMDVSFSASLSKPAASIPEHHHASPPLFASPSPPPPPPARKRPSSNALASKSPSRTGIGTTTTTRARRHLFRRLAQCLALVLALVLARAVSTRASA